MVNILVLIAVLSAFLSYDLGLRIGLALEPGKSEKIAERYQKKAIHLIFSLLRVYRSFELVLENRIGETLPPRFLFVSNHQSLLDIPVAIALLESRKLRFVAKKELGGGVPFVSLLLRTQGHALVRRSGDMYQAMGELERFARRCAQDGSCPLVFPEGTRTRDGEVGQFHTAGIRRILDLDSLPMLVAAVEGGCRLAKVGDVSKNLKGAKYRVRLVALLPAPQGKKEVLGSIEKARELIVSELVAMRSEEISAAAGIA